MKNDGDIAVIWGKIKDKLEQSLKYILLRIEKRLQEKKPWMNKKVIKVIKKKYASWKKYTRLRRNKDYQEYVIQRNKTTRICRNARIKI